MKITVGWLLVILKILKQGTDNKDGHSIHSPPTHRPIIFPRPPTKKSPNIYVSGVRVRPVFEDPEQGPEDHTAQQHNITTARRRPA